MQILTNTWLYLFREYEQEGWGVFSQSAVRCKPKERHHRDKPTTKIQNFYKIEMVNLTNENTDCRGRK
jgi:hypothetical protein